MGSFTDSINLFALKAQQNIGEVQRVMGLKILARLIELSPVGDPTTWKVNQAFHLAKTQADYMNDMQRTLNEAATGLPTLKRGQMIRPSTVVRFKTRDGKEISFDQKGYAAKRGYTGGRFRGNWQVGFNVRPIGETGLVDPSGSQALAVGRDQLQSYDPMNTAVVYFTNNVPYATRLEFGWSKQRPEGMVRVTAANFNKWVEDAVAEVRRREG
ncbi:hypothetical protein CHIBITOTORO_00010 [Serratia phage vB_SmaM-ChibiTotoro]|nr:hypothetical protein CHIBITOTORO_00010 [Serratia phage vB_SmaM-ChibiTotoro]